MNCSEADSLWIDWLYGELPPERESELESHRSDCPTCKATAQRLQAARGALEDFAAETPQDLRPWTGPPAARRHRAAGIALVSLAVCGWLLAGWLWLRESDFVPSVAASPEALLIQPAITERLDQVEEMNRLLAGEVERLESEQSALRGEWRSTQAEQEAHWKQRLSRIDRSLQTLFQAALGSTE